MLPSKEQAVIRKTSLSVCQKCGYRCDRDVAAAMVMLNYARGQELSSSDVESPSSTLCGSMKQLGAKKRQKPIPSASLG